MSMEIVIRDMNPAVVRFCQKEGLTAYCEDILSAPADALISPANSFGFMDGGVDLAYSNYFGWGLQERLQKTIRDDFGGELLIGQAVAVPTDNEKFPWLISAPTMRVAMVIFDVTHVRMAMRAAIREAMKLGVKRVVTPGLGTCTGRVAPPDAAKLMAAGVNDARGQPWFPTSLQDAHFQQYWAWQ